MSAVDFVALGGKLRSGKDVIADYLVEKHGFVKMGMSDPLHTALLTLNPIIAWEGDRPVTYSRAVMRWGYVKTKERYPEARRLLQALGTDVVRNQVDENAWARASARRVQEARDTGSRVVLTGVRFPNELEMVRSLNGVSVYVTRPGLPQQPLTHASEDSLGLVDFDHGVVNDFSIEALYARVDALLDRVNRLRDH